MTSTEHHAEQAEQRAIDLANRFSRDCNCEQCVRHDALTIQSAFAAREADLVARLRQLSIVLTDHLGGGSEWFSAIGDDYFVDPKAIKAELQRRKTDAQITKRALVRANSREAELVGALEKGGFMMTEPHNIGEHRARKLVIGFQNPDDADNAMAAISVAVKPFRSAK